MNNRIYRSLAVVAATMVLAGCGSVSYNGKVDVVGIGAGAKPMHTDTNYVEKAKVQDIHLLYADKIKIKEQDASKTVKYIAGDALVKEYSGEPKLLVDYLNAYQKLSNLVLIVDKNGVVAWEGKLKTTDFDNATGVYDYGLTGADRMSFNDAMEKFVAEGDEAEEYDAEKTPKFPKDNTESLMSGFSYATKYPFLFVKLEDMSFTDANGKEVHLSEFTQNGKPAVLIFYMAEGKKSRDIHDDLSMASSLLHGFSSDTKTVKPEVLLESIEKRYFQK